MVRKGDYRVLYRVDDGDGKVWIEDVTPQQGIR
jgi:mRNA-degrading endonuclease RelE of RelBE toxin-antitoxin system